MFFGLRTNFLKYSRCLIFNNAPVEIPFEGDACLRGKGLLQSKGFMGCIALGGYFELEKNKHFSLLTHRSANDSETNLARFHQYHQTIAENGRIMRGSIYIFHLDPSETIGAGVKLPYEHTFSSSYESLINRLKHLLSFYGYNVGLVPYSIKPEHTTDQTGTVFINTETMTFGTNLRSHNIEFESKPLQRCSL